MSARRQNALTMLSAHPIAYPLLGASRRLGPVLRVPGFGVIVHDAALAHEILSRDADFTKCGPGSFAESVTRVLGPGVLINMDGPAHQRLRSQLADLLAPANAQALLSGCAPRLAELRAALAAGATVDLAAFMRRLSGQLTFDMLGITPPPGAEAAAFEELITLGERIASGLGLRQPSAGQVRALQADCARLAVYTRAGFANPAAPPSSLVQRFRALGFGFEEARGLLAIFFLTGTLTTAAALPRIAALLLDSGQFELLRRGEVPLAQAVHEGLRYTAPVPATMRIAARAVALGGHHFEPGTRLLVATYSLARDPGLFPDPSRFDITRPVEPRARQLWFGAGPHFCLGFALAQRELAAVLEALAAAPGPLAIVGRRRARRVLIPAYTELSLRRADAA